MNDNGIFKKKTGYTVVDNPVVRDKKLSLKAKGLYLLIQSYITMPNIILKKSSLHTPLTTRCWAKLSIWKRK